MLNKKILDHLHHELFCRLGVSSINGVGVFAVRPIPIKVDPLVSSIEDRYFKVSLRELASLPAGVRKLIRTFCENVGKNMLIPKHGLNTVCLSIYLNHSKAPNVKMMKNGSFRTLRPIKKGEELIMDYDKSFGEKHTFWRAKLNPKPKSRIRVKRRAR